MRLNYSILFILILFFFAAPCLASSGGVGTYAMDFEKLGRGSVKAEAIGEAVTALKELSSMGLNPASISNLEHIEFQLQYLAYFQDISYKGLMGVFPTPYGNVGIDVGVMNMGSQQRTVFSNRSGEGLGHFSNVGYQTLIAYGVQHDRLGMGVGCKYVSEILDDYHADSVGLDVGLDYEVEDNVWLGVAVNNITLKKAEYNGAAANLAKSFRIGVHHAFVLFGNKARMMADYVWPDDDKAYCGVGVDFGVSDFLSLRGGYSTYGDITDLSFGVGLLLENVTVDFSYKPSREFGQSYRVGFGWKL